jgi:hypothetical protein
MVWIYYDNDDYTFSEVFELFLSQCTLDQTTMKEELKKGPCIRYVISTSDEHNEIIHNRKTFLKTKFLMNKLFKKRLVEYYRPMNIYVNGPKQISKTNGETIDKWLIELTTFN